MDATRRRRTRDEIRNRWYAYRRCYRFARHLSFTTNVCGPSQTFALRPVMAPVPACEHHPEKCVQA